MAHIFSYLYITIIMNALSSIIIITNYVYDWFIFSFFLRIRSTVMAGFLFMASQQQVIIIIFISIS